jgi:ribosomal protein S4
MNINDRINEFLNNKSNSINLIEFIGKYFDLGTFSEKIQLKFITDGLIKVNNIVIRNPDYKLKPGSKVEYNRLTKTYKKENSSEHDIDNFYQFLTTELFSVNDLDTLTNSESKIIFCHLVHFLSKISYDDIIHSQYGREVDEYLRKTINKNGFVEDLNLTKQEAKGRLLVEKLIESLKSSENDFAKLLSNLENSQFDNQLDGFLRTYGNIIHTNKFRLLIEPMTDNLISSRIAIENLLKPLFTLEKITNEGSKYQHYTINKEIYSDFLEKAKGSESNYSKTIFIPICNYLLALFKSKSKIKEEQFGELGISLLDRRYNINRDELTILFEVKNSGNGIAAQCSVSINENEYFKGDNDKDLGIIQPVEIRSSDLKVFKKKSENFKPTIDFNITWENANGEGKKKVISLDLHIQDKLIPWDELKRKKPYSITKIDSEENLFGRDSILEELKENILSSKIESYKIWGQKRVGKSSIVLTLKSILDQEENIIVVYKEVSRNINPTESLNELGKEISIELLAEILTKLTDIHKADRIREIELPQFNGSLQPLERYIKNIHRIDKKLKFVFILDEFDRLNEEFFLPGNIGESFSLSIGKQISGNDNVGFILVGAENMSLLDYQEINYNSFIDQRVDTFDQNKDFEAYTNIIKKPVEPHITYSDEAVNEIFLTTNGNPYFTNFICDKLFKSCFERQDSEVDIVEVRKAISLIVDSEQKSHFAHFWGDGLNQDSDAKREKTTDIRRRILVSYSNYFHNKKEHPTKSDIVKSFNYPQSYTISQDEIESIISSFFTRSIFFYEKNNKKIRIKPELFERWLCGKGRTLIIEGITDLEAQERENENEEIARIKEDEINRLTQTLKFKSTSISRDKFTNYFKQFGSNVEQRKIFNIIDNLFFVSHDDITDFIKKEKRNIFGNDPIVVKDKSSIPVREGVEVYCSSKVKNESEILFETFKILTNLRKNRTLKSLKEKKVWYTNDNTKTIVIFEPYISDIATLELELKEFFEFNQEDLIDKKTIIVLFSFVCTKKAKIKLVQLLKQYSNTKFISLNEVEEVKIKPFIESNIILENISESQQVLSACRNIYQNTSKDESLVVFENLCPASSLKILWKKSDQFNPLFHNQFSDDLEHNFESDKGRETIFKLNTELSQKLNSYIISFLKSSTSNGDWVATNLVPRSVINKVNERYYDAKEKESKESLLDFIDYGDIIKKHDFLKKTLSIKGDLGWLNKINELRRIPAHPEKANPTIEEVEYFEKIHMTILESIKNNPIVL